MASSSVAPDDLRTLLYSPSHASSSSSSFFFPLNSLSVGGFAPSLNPSRRRATRPSFSAKISCAGSKFRGRWEEFNKFVRLYSGGLPAGFASIQVSGNGSGSIVDRPVAAENGESGAGALESDRAKRVLILMSDTGGGHRASAEAIKAAFFEEYGDEYKVRLSRSIYIVIYHYDEEI